LPTLITHLVQSPTNLLGQNALVSELIDQDQGCWKRDLLNKVFLPEEARVIANIPLSPFLPQDRQIWKATKNGIFIVRSAYHLGKELIAITMGQCSESNLERGVWKFIWSMRVPNQVKMFTWRACHNILLTCSILVQLKVFKDSLCPCCKREPETTLHVLWNCPAAQDIWGGGEKITISKVQK
jgi:hypothetical protein